MSSMLEQAIIDASALKEAAIKNAEAAIIEKYAPEVKKAVETLLEQPGLGDEPDIAGPDLGLGGDEFGASAMESDVDMDLAAAEGENLCPCPDEGEKKEYVVDIDQLRKIALQEPEGAPEDLGALAGEIPLPGEEEELALQEEININDDLLTALLSEAGCPPEEGDENGDKEDDSPWGKWDDDDFPLAPWDEDGPKDPEEEIEINEENISDIIEELVVDMEPQKTGWLGTGLPRA
jgi:hypothetical protein